ncbi:MAG: ATP-binding cassette domain-containing protein [Proteobacteria bacterium]|nr:ATP-binding cassette domain-containing protein [Pseudomonadota bacterium]
MSLIRFENISLDFGDQKILTDAMLAIEPGERVCFIGRNGAGKSTTLKLITGEIEPDRGEIIRRTGLVVSQLAQELPDAMDLNVQDVVRSGLAGIEALLQRYQALSAQDLDRKGLRDLEALHQQIDAHDGWHLQQRVETTMAELNLPVDKMMSELSGGWRRRVALAKALVQKPDLLLLDEPTNHLDIVTIKWLENIVYSYAGSVLFITHDRAFLQRLATRIVEIDRGKLTSWPGDFRNYQLRKEKALEDEETENAKFDKRLDKEEIWIRQGIKARRTRNEGRVRTLMKMRTERAQRIGRGANARMHIDEGEKSGRKVIRARNVFYSYDDKPLIEDFSVKIMRGDRIGVLGNNGVGKTTLLRLLLGDIEPQSGTIKHGTNLEIGYFDQLRQTLDPEKSIAENVGDGRTFIRLNGKDRHIVGYLKGFLFDPKRSMTPVKSLSGGERNRVILAKLFTKPANLLVLDEPTNDLDMETLEILEDKLVNYSGTLIIISHDRQFLDNVVTSTIVFEENGEVREYVGGYSDWLRQGHQLTELDNPIGTEATADTAKSSSKKAAPVKLGYKDQRALDELPEEIEALEQDLAEIEATMSAANFYSQDHESVQQVLAELAETQSSLEQRMDRWTELANRKEQYDRSRDRSA